MSKSVAWYSTKPKLAIQQEAWVKKYYTPTCIKRCRVVEWMFGRNCLLLLAIEVLPLFSCDEPVSTLAEPLDINGGGAREMGVSN